MEDQNVDRGIAIRVIEILTAAHPSSPSPFFTYGMSEPLPRLQLVTRLQESAAAWAPRTRRNGQQITMYAERCTEIVGGLDQSLRVRLKPSLADPEYLQDLMVVSRLEV